MRPQLSIKAMVAMQKPPITDSALLYYFYYCEFMPYLPRSEAAVTPSATPMPSSGPSAHAVLVRSIVAGVCAAVLGLCIFIWVIYILHRWWAVRAEALRPRVNVNGVGECQDPAMV